MKLPTKEKSSKKLQKQETPLSNQKVDFFNLPVIPAVVRPSLEAKADELGLLINPYMKNKIDWSEEHDGRCMCDWMNRKCPCTEIEKDLIEYNGECLCKVLVTKEKMEKIEKNRKVKYKEGKGILDKKEQKKRDNTKIKEAEELAKKLGCKNCK